MLLISALVLLMAWAALILLPVSPEIGSGVHTLLLAGLMLLLLAFAKGRDGAMRTKREQNRR